MNLSIQQGQIRFGEGINPQLTSKGGLFYCHCSQIVEKLQKKAKEHE